MKFLSKLNSGSTVKRLSEVKGFKSLPLGETWRGLFLSLLTIISLQTFAQDAVINDANVEKRSLSGSFTAIKVSDGIDLYLSQGNTESIAVSASDPKYLERFKTVVDNGVLKIYYDNSAVIWNSNDRRKLKAYVSFKMLEKLNASSGASVDAKNILNLAYLDMHLSSGAQFNGEVKIGEMSVDQNSGSEVNITGSVEKIKVNMSSGAIFKGYDLNAEYCEAKASSGGEARVNVNKELAAKASSGGGIKYKGNASIKDLDVSSGGVVKKS